MAQFDVHENPNRASRSIYPYVVVLQSDYTTTRETVIVAPLVRKAEPGSHAKLQSAVIVNGEQLVVLFASLSAVRPYALGKPLTALPELRESIAKVIDLLFLGL
jgi:toxin CcdB